MVAGGENEQFRDLPAAVPPVNPDVFREMPTHQHPSDRGSERVEQASDANLDYARAKATETANMFLLRQSQLTPAEFKVMGGVLDLGLKTNAWTQENIGQIQECLYARAGHQQNAMAAQGLRSMAEKIGKVEVSNA